MSPMRIRPPGLSHSSNPLHALLALRMAWKGLLRSPGTTFLAVGILTLGLAAPTVFFSLLVGVVRPLPVPDGHRVVRVEVRHPMVGQSPLPLTMEDFQELREAASLEALGAFRTLEGSMRDAGLGAVGISGAALTSQVLPLLGVAPILGRGPVLGEEGNTLLLGHDLWMRVFEGDPEILGRVVTLDGVSRTIIGVMAPGFGFPLKHEVWIGLEERLGDGDPVELVGRLGHGESKESAAVELGGIWRRGELGRDPALAGASLDVLGFTQARGEGGEGIAFLGLVMVALALLLIACATVANLFLVRASERVRNLAVQAALGAGGGQVGLQVFLEALLVAFLGGAAGIVLAWMLVEAIQQRFSAEHFGYFWMEMAVDGRVLAFTLFLVFGTALVSGLLPMIRILRVDLQGVLKEATSGMSLGGSGVWSRGFVTVQLALSCGALVAAGLTGVAMWRGSSFGETLPGTETVLASFPVDSLRLESLVPELEASVAGAPPVLAASFSLGAPGFGEPWGRVEVEGEQGSGLENPSRVAWNAVTPAFFTLFDMDVRTGRGLSSSDDMGAEPVAVVNESFVRRFLPEGDPVGRRIRLDGVVGDVWFTIVGVVGDLEMGGGSRMRNDRVYLSLPQVPSPKIMVLARTGGDALELPRQLRERIASVDPTIPLWSIRTLADAHAYLIRVPRAMALTAFLGGLAGLVVAVVGLYGLLSFRVRQRRLELGMKLALGADGFRLARDVLLLALWQLVPAILLGTVVTWVLAPLLTVVLMGGDPRSPAVFAGVGVGFLVAGMGAALVPALRAARLDPARILSGNG